ncbi:unnamed protein product [Danaus chrysippus]|uniref:(African queen) hypothetical protein n=1 Tax=Danaus chrysippus TaxID=151541 RepID=A0A8J2QYE9_9NEOP|nr:unnamed protein product [Danaus chrysippus]
MARRDRRYRATKEHDAHAFPKELMETPEKECIQTQASAAVKPDQQPAGAKDLAEAIIRAIQSVPKGGTPVPAYLTELPFFTGPSMNSLPSGQFPMVTMPFKRALWSEDDLIPAVRAVQRGSLNWFKAFLKRNPEILVRKAQFMNPYRAQKLNRFIVDNHFAKLRTIYENLDLHGHPERIYNMDEKGCRLTIHHQQSVLAKKGAKSVTIAGCVNALGTIIPPMVIFKGKRLKPELYDNLPPGSLVEKSSKGGNCGDTVYGTTKNVPSKPDQETLMKKIGLLQQRINVLTEARDISIAKDDVHDEIKKLRKELKEEEKCLKKKRDC